MPSKVNSDMWRAVKEAMKALEAASICGVLIGTCGIAAHGYDVLPPDVDILVPSRPEWAGATGGYRDEETSGHEWLYETEVQYVVAGRNPMREWCLAADPVIIDGVPVAKLQHILALKRAAGRLKDDEFFIKHPDLEVAAEVGVGGILDDILG